MDSNSCYQQMLDAIEEADQQLALARQRALALHQWQGEGGFYPSNISESEVRTVINQVFMRTEEAEGE
jgi:hypothetical protein